MIRPGIKSYWYITKTDTHYLGVLNDNRETILGRPFELTLTDDHSFHDEDLCRYWFFINLKQTVSDSRYTPRLP